MSDACPCRFNPQGAICSLGSPHSVNMLSAKCLRFFDSVMILTTIIAFAISFTFCFMIYFDLLSLS